LPDPDRTNLAPGDRVVVSVDQPTAGMKSGEVVWVRSVSDRLTVMRANGQGAPVEIDPAHVRPAVDSDFESAASARRRRHASDDFSPWAKRLIGPITAILLALLAWYRWEDVRKFYHRPGDAIPPPPRVQEPPMPRQR
jgi:hypothetical protein